MGYVDHSRTLDSDYAYRKAETNAFVSDFKSCLLELNIVEQRVLRLWLDTNFNTDNHTTEEISKRTGLSPNAVEYVEKEAMAKVRKNPIMEKYKGLFK